MTNIVATHHYLKLARVQEQHINIEKLMEFNPTRSWISINYIDFNDFRRNILVDDDPRCKEWCMGNNEYIYEYRNQLEIFGFLFCNFLNLCDIFFLSVIVLSDLQRYLSMLYWC